MELDWARYGIGWVLAMMFIHAGLSLLYFVRHSHIVDCEIHCLYVYLNS